MKEILAMLLDHLELVTLEAHFEARQTLRRLFALATACILAGVAFLCLQIAVIAGLMKTGLALWQAGLCLAGVYGLAAWILGRWGGRRSQKVGPPFEASCREFRDTIEWIRKIF